MSMRVCDHGIGKQQAGRCPLFHALFFTGDGLVRGCKETKRDPVFVLHPFLLLFDTLTGLYRNFK